MAASLTSPACTVATKPPFRTPLFAPRPLVPQFGLPDLAGRVHILKIHAKSMAVDKDIRYELLARLCPSSTGAELRSVCTEAGMYAIRGRRKSISEKDFLESINKVIRSYKKFSSTPKYMVCVHGQRQGGGGSGWAPRGGAGATRRSTGRDCDRFFLRPLAPATHPLAPFVLPNVAQVQLKARLCAARCDDDEERGGRAPSALSHN